MFLRVNSILPIGHDYKVVSLFGYRSNGVPGIEIKGLPNNQNVVREKLVYLSKMFGVKVPIRRFHLCLDLPKEVLKMKKNSIDDRYFDLPLLLLYWSLAEVIHVHGLEYCFSLGHIETNGRIMIPSLSETFLIHLQSIIKEKTSRSMTFISAKENDYLALNCLPINSILDEVKMGKSKSIAL